jgi:hypothetical protein
MQDKQNIPISAPNGNWHSFRIWDIFTNISASFSNIPSSYITQQPRIRKYYRKNDNVHQKQNLNDCHQFSHLANHFSITTSCTANGAVERMVLLGLTGKQCPSAQVWRRHV